MKKLFTILCAGMLFLSSAEAKIVMTESFDREIGTLTILFQSDQEGVHEAYIELSSSEAVPVYIPMSVLCKSKTEGIKNVQRDKVQGTKILRDGHLYLLYDGKMYDVQGRLVD